MNEQVAQVQQEPQERTPAIVAVRASGIRFEGVNRLAREIGCSGAHLSQVLHGLRVPSRRIAEALRERGVPVMSVSER